MNQTALVVGLCLVCAVSGVAFGMAWDSRAPNREDLEPEDTSLARALEQLSVQLAALDERLAIRQAGPSLASARPPQDAERAAADEPVETGRAAVLHEPADGEDGARVVRTTPEYDQLPPARRDRLRGLGKWEDEGVRASWLFVSERGVLHELGMPDSVSGGGGSEYWTYHREDEANVTIQFHGGRVVRVSP